jgi:hypothetical protein
LVVYNREMPAPDPIEDAIHARAGAERKTPGVSFAPIYAFVSNIAHIARGQERQTIVNNVTAERPPGMSAEWNAGYEAATMAVVRAAVSRSFTH